MLHTDYVAFLIRQHSRRQVVAIDGASHHLQQGMHFLKGQHHSE